VSKSKNNLLKGAYFILKARDCSLSQLLYSGRSLSWLRTFRMHIAIITLGFARALVIIYKVSVNLDLSSQETCPCAMNYVEEHTSSTLQVLCVSYVCNST